MSKGHLLFETDEAGFLSGGKIRTKKTLANKRFQKFNTRLSRFFQKFFFEIAFLFLKIRRLKSSVIHASKPQSRKFAVLSPPVFP